MKQNTNKNIIPKPNHRERIPGMSPSVIFVTGESSRELLCVQLVNKTTIVMTEDGHLEKLAE